MAGDDDIAAHLPKPPPPSPLPRQRAIDAALRRFDAAQGASQPATEPLSAERPRKPWWSTLGQPQVAALVTAGLVALLGVPAAWLSVSQRSAPVSEAQLATRGSARADGVASSPARDVAASPDVAGTSPGGTAEQPLPPPAAQLLAAEEAKDRDMRAAPQADAVSPPPSGLARAETAPIAESRARPAEALRAAKPVQLADAAPPPAAPMAAAPPPPPAPPPPAMVASADTGYSSFSATAGRQPASAKSERMVPAGPPATSTAPIDDRNITVTGQRRTGRALAGRGDWNACTINDPARSLQRCRAQVNSGAAGAAGRAAVHVAAGLRRAWDGDLDGAIADFDQAIAASPRSAIAHLNRGLALQRKGEFGRAAADLDRAVRLAPASARSYHARAQLLRQRGEANRADADEDRALALDPGYVAVIN